MKIQNIFPSDSETDEIASAYIDKETTPQENDAVEANSDSLHDQINQLAAVRSILKSSTPQPPEELRDLHINTAIKEAVRIDEPLESAPIPRFQAICEQLSSTLRTARQFTLQPIPLVVVATLLTTLGISVFFATLNNDEPTVLTYSDPLGSEDSSYASTKDASTKTATPFSGLSDQRELHAEYPSVTTTISTNTPSDGDSAHEDEAEMLETGNLSQDDSDSVETFQGTATNGHGVEERSTQDEATASMDATISTSDELEAINLGSLNSHDELFSALKRFSADPKSADVAEMTLAGVCATYLNELFVLLDYDLDGAFVARISGESSGGESSPVTDVFINRDGEHLKVFYATPPDCVRKVELLEIIRR